LAAAGYQPLSLFTGNASDETNVFLTGRNDGSGTRTTYLAETGVGITTLIKQYVTVDSTSTALKAIQEVPAGGVNDSDGITAGIQLPTGSAIKAYDDGPSDSITQSANNASTVWGQNVAGNGGYSSGSTLRGDMGKTGASVRVFDAAGADFDTSTPMRVDFVTFLSLNDAVTARDSGAILCAYNGVKLDGIAAYDGPSGDTELTTMSAADKAKVTTGLYTAWGYQQMYRRGDITTGDAVTVYDGILDNIGDNLAAAGIAVADMVVGREFDGGTVAP
jgi:hypothetical protein